MSKTTNVMNSEVVKRLLCYVSYDTQSKDESSEVPSTQKQFDLAKVLKKELEEIGALDVRLSDLETPFFTHQDIVDGGTLELTMGSEPLKPEE